MYVMGEEEREEEGAAQIGWTNVLIEQRGESPRVVRTVRTKRVVLFTFFFLFGWRWSAEPAERLRRVLLFPTAGVCVEKRAERGKREGA